MHVVVGIGTVGREIQTLEIVYELDMFGLSVSLQLGVDVLHRFGDISGFGTPSDIGGGREGAQDGFDVVGLGQLAHADYVFHDFLGTRSAGVEANVVDAGENDHILGTQGDDVGAHAAEDLRGALAGDAAVQEVVVGEEVGIGIFPDLGDGIAQKDCPGPYGDSRVFFFVSFCVREIGVLRKCAEAAEQHRNNEQCFCFHSVKIANKWMPATIIFTHRIVHKFVEKVHGRCLP